MVGDQDSRLAQAYRRSFARLCAGTVGTIVADLDSPTSTASGRLLDAGCGTGNVARATAGRGWTVTATDVDAQMLEVGRAECAGLPVRWVRSALPQSGLRADAFDSVVANFVVNNLADARATVRELARVTRPGGVVALTAWVSDRATHIDLIKETLRVAGLREPTRHRLSEVDFERTVDGLTTLVHRSGLDPVRSHELTWVWTISWDDLWAGLAACMGPTYPTLNTSDQKRIVNTCGDTRPPSRGKGTSTCPASRPTSWAAGPTPADPAQHRFNTSMAMGSPR